MYVLLNDPKICSNWTVAQTFQRLILNQTESKSAIIGLGGEMGGGRKEGIFLALEALAELISSTFCPLVIPLEI